jgi:hypothetical protein
MSDIIFVDDSQKFPDLTSMIKIFLNWGTAFIPA